MTVIPPRGSTLTMAASPDPDLSRSSVAAVHRHDAGAAEAEVVLQRGPHIIHLSLLRLSPQLPDQFRALRQPGSADGMTLGQQATGRVDHPAALGNLPFHRFERRTR